MARIIHAAGMENQMDWEYTFDTTCYIVGRVRVAWRGGLP